MSPVTQIGQEQDPAKRLRQRWGTNIARYRKLRGLTQTQLAESVGVTQQAVAAWEAGEAAPRWHHQAAIAEAFDAPHAAVFPMEAA